MKYMGSKDRHAREIIPLLLENHSKDSWYIEPFVGGANVIDKIPVNIAPLRAGCDINEYLIALWQAVSEGWMPPEVFTEEDYQHMKSNKRLYPKELVGYVGFALSYGGKWFGGWRRDSKGKRDYVSEAYRNALKQFPKLKGVTFLNRSVFDLSFKNPCTIYCDPPYKGTTKYKDTFSHDSFYSWCRLKKDEGHTVFISEYSMPEDFKCIWTKSVKNSLTKNTGGKMAQEKLFTL